MKISYLICFLILILFAIFFLGCEKEIRNIERPEKIVSKRQVVYNEEIYIKLANLWETYYNEFPSEDAYANWMRAADYAGLQNYDHLLEKGLAKYPNNPTLLYLTALTKYGATDNSEAITILERASRLDPTYLDPWFALAVDYMASGNKEKADVALRKLLEEHAISDEVMDYNYNVITLLDKNAILITNGDNDTYPGWILTRIVNYRPDVRIVNLSLLNSEWYPSYLVRKEGIPNFITRDELLELRKTILLQIKKGKSQIPPTGPFSDTLLTLLINSARVNNIPVYLASTLYSSKIIDEYKEKGFNLGLITLVEPSGQAYSSMLKSVIDKWLNEFRIGGLESWNLKYGKESAAGKLLIINYGEALKSLMGAIIKYLPDKRIDLFHWYQKYLADLIPADKIDTINSSWCQSDDVKEINDWCKSKSYIK